MRKQPFHRKILPWIFVITFIGVAPALVFYTAGYRWNPKKGKIERNGTVIIDSVPANADISIDGRPIPEKTPVTIQNMAPGVHTFLISKTGYYSWQKSFDVIPERVTFANDIKLFKQAEPSLVRPLVEGKISLSTDDRTVLFVPNTTTTPMSLIDTRSPSIELPVGVPPGGVSGIFWSPNGRYALIEAADATGSSWLLDTNGARQLTQLPTGRYRWEGSQLIGNDGSDRNDIHLPDFSLTRTPLPPRSVDALDNNLLVSPTGTSDIVYIDSHTPLQGFLLPGKEWTFWTAEKNEVLLRDGSSWLSLVPHNTGVDFHTAQGEMLVPDLSSKLPRYLLVNDTELWIWNPLSEPDLLLRHSDPIVNAVWDRDGKNVLYATEQKIIALNLDPRDGRLETTLAQFDHVYDLTLTGKLLYVLATKNNHTGLWMITVE